MNKKSYLIAKIIYDRDFDIPEWLYRHIDLDTMKRLIKMLQKSNKESIITKYNFDPNVEKFFDTISDRVKIKKDFIKYLYDDGLSDYAVILLKKREFKYYKHLYDNDTSGSRSSKSVYHMVYNYTTTSDKLIGKGKDIVKYSGEKKSNFLVMGATLKAINDNVGTKNILREQIKTDRLLEILEVEESYELCELAYDIGIPALFKYADKVDLYKYLSRVLDSNWVASIKCNVDTVPRSCVNLLIKIAKRLNSNALVYLEDELTDAYIVDIMNTRGSTNPPKKKITDFKSIVKFLGHNNYGLPINIQKDFLSNGGDVQTMFSNGILMGEASILRTLEECPFVIDTINNEGLYYLLHNSSDFVKSVLSCKWITYQNMFKILDVLFEYPINEELWNVLNGRSEKYSSDFRYVIITKFMSYLTNERVFDQIPQAMMYINPSIFYITRHIITKDTVKYIPVEKLVSYIKSILSREEFIQFNLFCNGKQISLSDLFTDYTVLIQNIVSYKKYGYLCDITNVDGDTLIDTVTKYL